MVKLQFNKKEERSWFFDPKEKSLKKSISFEIREDFLTGHVSRILPYRRKFPETEIPLEMLEASKKVCPFCPDQILSSTPNLPPDIAPEGRMQRGRAWLFPNAFPYARYNWVVVFSQDHFLDLNQFTVEIMKDGFLLAQEGIERLRRNQPDFQYSSINWNYLPSAGGGIFHPHIQVVIEDTPTTSHQKVLEGLSKYGMDHKSSFWEDYLAEEIARDERYIGHQGDVHFLTAFSPRAIFGEIFILFSNRSIMEEVTSIDWTHFSQGLIHIFQYLKNHIISFNLSLFSGNRGETQSFVYGRLCPRMLMPPWKTSDINYFEKLHDEVMCSISPEELCKDIKPNFTG